MRTANRDARNAPVGLRPGDFDGDGLRAACLCCQREFTYGATVPAYPARVTHDGWLIPGSGVRNPRAPICHKCVRDLNAAREAIGRTPWPIGPDAYPDPSDDGR